jgi:hypothetical protein
MTRVLLAAALAALAVAGCGDGGDNGAPDTDTGLDISVCDPANGPFSLTIDNEFFPLEVGTVLVLEGDEDGALVRVEFEVLDETEEIAGVTTRVVQERETEDGMLVEISRNFFAQAPDGTVCYFGEDVDIYGEDGGVVDHEGAWRAGADGALAGIQMPAAPEVGMKYYQEYAPSVAQDMGEITAMGEHLSVPAGEFDDTLEVTETSPLDSGSSLKIYVSGIGMAVDESITLRSY